MNAVPTLQVENERVIVTKWTFAPGAETGHHVHGHDYVVVPLTTGKLRLVEPTGIRDVELTAGGSYARLTGVAHNVININDHEFSFVEIELK
jgi:quercetin dioxygenase-like cupin family protein